MGRREFSILAGGDLPFVDPYAYQYPAELRRYLEEFLQASVRSRVGSQHMKNTVWSNLANVKFKALYTYECSREADRYGRLTSAFLALASTSSVAAWAIWKEHPAIWGGIIGISQVMQVVKPYISVIGSDKDLLEMSFEYEQLFLEYEKLWYAVCSGSIADPAVTERIAELHKKSLDIERAHKNVHAPKRQRLIDKVYTETEKFLELNFS